MTQTNEEWAAGFEARIAELQRKSEQLTESFNAAGATASSPDGGVRVTVGPNGALQEVQLGPSVARFAPAELAGIINRTAAKAAQMAAHQVRAAFAPFAQGTEAMALFDSFLPPPPTPVSDAPVDGLAADDEIAESSSPAPPPRPQAPQPPRRPPAPSKRDDDDEFDQPW
ncbi:YbaB/EbfC family nucleoid-associated protein [Actinophytocola sp.]|uniref:YbaB/EbfC family nucleoid-associated protein n=1 Tax=Actinophytocola sp. TaxID=1872138 RepID=UPI002ED2597C